LIEIKSKKVDLTAKKSEYLSNFGKVWRDEVFTMDKEYLEDYQAKEREEYYTQVIKKIENGTFDFSRDKYPSDNRFERINRPVTDCNAFFCFAEDRWDQVPYNGTTIIPIEANPSSIFEKFYFKVSEIPELIDFIKETGKIQIALQDEPTLYEGGLFGPIF
jgi:hypothetical protein